MRISETMDNDDEQLGLRLEDVVNDDGEGSDDVGDVHTPIQLSGEERSPSVVPPVLTDSQTHSVAGAPMSSQHHDPSHAQQLFDHAALEAQITDLLTVEAARPASRVAAAAAAARQRNTNTRANRAGDKVTTDSQSKATADSSSMSYPLSLAAGHPYPLPPPPIGYPPQGPMPSEHDSTESGEAMPGSEQHQTDNAVGVGGVLDPAAGHPGGQPQNFADITDILAHLSAHLESAAAAAAAAGNASTTHAVVGSSGAEDDDESPHEGHEEEDEEEDEAGQSAAVGERAPGPEGEEDFSRPFVCDVPKCGKGFGRKSDLARHLRIHSGERPYPCDQPGCGKSFIQRSALNVHKRVHTGEKPHTCEFPTCDKTFGDSSSLARHRRTHTGRRPYKCDDPLCDKTFTRRTTLNRHMRVHMPGFDPHSRPAKRRRTDEEFTDIPAIGSFITPRAALPGGVRPVPQMSHSTMISLGSGSSGGPSGSEALAEGSGQMPSHSDNALTTALDGSWTEQTNENAQAESSEGTIGNEMAETHGSNEDVHAEMAESSVYPEDWVRDMVGEADAEQPTEPQRSHGKAVGRLPPPALTQAVSY